ncbi:hypothetical protein [Corynebacterium cystitidis]|uniref:hypothetical protein n=1 Tax=Corynebacterium cystitidis TaxID=35757 RepID=UPI00211ED373|nr:hypothetical protein [Corynebacterium cystitidis]
MAHPFAVSFGWSESSGADGSYQDQWDQILTDVAAMGATGIDLTVGRADWSLVPHPGESKNDLVRHSSSTVGRDRLRPVMDNARSKGIQNIRVTVDTMLTEHLKTAPTERSVSHDGTVRTSLPSAWSLTEGTGGQMVRDQVAAVARTWPDLNAIVLTELHWDDGSFSDKDLEIFKADTGLSDWPRADQNRPDIANEQVRDWLTTRMAMFLESAREAAGSVPVIADVRVNWGNPLAGRPESGQDYRKHLQVVDALQGWTFFQPGDVQNAIDWSAAVEAKWPGRVSTAAQVRPTTDPAELARFVTELKTAPAGTQIFPWAALTREMVVALGAPGAAFPDPGVSP